MMKKLWGDNYFDAPKKLWRTENYDADGKTLTRAFT